MEFQTLYDYMNVKPEPVLIVLVWVSSIEWLHHINRGPASAVCRYKSDPNQWLGLEKLKLNVDCWSLYYFFHFKQWTLSHVKCLILFFSPAWRLQSHFISIPNTMLCSGWQSWRRTINTCLLRLVYAMPCLANNHFYSIFLFPSKRPFCSVQH